MKLFSELYTKLDRTTSSNARRDAITAYLQSAPPEDAIWGLYLLSGGRINTGKTRFTTTSELRAWVSDLSGYPDWLVAESYDAVGDLAETIALLVGKTETRMEMIPLSTLIISTLLPLAGQDEAMRKTAIQKCWLGLNPDERLVFNKILTGALRVGVSARTAQLAVSAATGNDVSLIAQRMLGPWEPTRDFWDYLHSSATNNERDLRQPYPFYLASPLETDPEEALGPLHDWIIEWKWDGIRLQIIKRRGEVALWSRGEERLDGRFPEIEVFAASLPDCVIDAELLGWVHGHPSPLTFTQFQRRIQRRNPGEKLLKEVPAVAIAYDLIEFEGTDIRSLPLLERRQLLAEKVLYSTTPTIMLSPALTLNSWSEATALRDQAREKGTEGLMLKRAHSIYKDGRKRGDWWKWKIDPLSVDAVLIYAQPGHGRRSTLYTDYTFALWDDDGQLVPVAKAYSGLTDREILALDRWIRTNTRERFGPVRSVNPVQVFEIAFEAVNKSTRHKSGIAVRFPRIVRWRKDKRASEADQLSTLKVLAR